MPFKNYQSHKFIVIELSWVFFFFLVGFVLLKLENVYCKPILYILKVL